MKRIIVRSMNKVQGQNPKQDIPNVHIKYSNDPIQTGKTAGDDFRIEPI